MVLSKVNVVLQKTRKTLIVAFQELKLIASPKAERATTARKKKKAGAKGKTVVANTKRAKVTNLKNGGAVGYETKAKRPFRGKKVAGTAVARGCGA